MKGTSSLVLFATVVSVFGTVTGSVAHAVAKRSISESESNMVDYPDYEYRKVFPKRTALLLDRLMVALQKAVDHDDVTGGGGGGGGNAKTLVRSMPELTYGVSSQRIPGVNGKSMDLQRRGQVKGRVYWRCYFNAVTCF